MGQHLAACCTSTRSNSYSFWRQPDIPVADFDDAAYQIDGEIAGSKHRPLAMDLQLVPQRRAHAGSNSVHSERLVR